MSNEHISGDYIESLAGKLELVIAALDSKSFNLPDDLVCTITNILIDTKKVVKSYPVEKYNTHVTGLSSVVNMGTK